MTFISNKKIWWLLAIAHILVFGIYFILLYWCPTHESRFYYQLILSRIFLCSASTLGVVMLIKNIHLLKDAKSAPLGLAILRILFFGMMFFGGVFRYHYWNTHFVFFSEFVNPNNLPDKFSKGLWGLIPINPTSVHFVFLLFIVTSFSSFIGLKTQWSAFLFAICAVFLFGIPNLSGKINHNQDLFWLPALLAFSKCSDILSIDAYLKKRSSNLEPPLTSFKYALPTFAIWGILGICYFFPGFWKMWNSGLDWVFSNNIKYQLYQKWSTLPNYKPLFRLDLYPFLYKCMGLFTLWFELSFLFLLPFKKTRKIGIIAGIIFHIGTLLFMDIFFIIFLMAYIPLFNYSKIWHRFQSNLKQKEQTIFTQNKPLLIVFAILVFGFGIYGAFKIDSWPFACYPRFDGMASGYQVSVSAVYCPPEKPCYDLNKNEVRKIYSPERLAFLENQIIQDSMKATGKLQELEQIYRKVYRLNDLGRIQFYITKQSLHPDSLRLENRRRIE